MNYSAQQNAYTLWQVRFEPACPDYSRQAAGRNEHFSSTCL
jgi:hypothetical protein